MSVRVLAGLVVGCLLLTAVILAADIHARRMEIVQTPDGQETVFRDSVTIVDGMTLIMAQHARFNESRGIAIISDSVYISNPDADIRADSAVYFMDDRVTELFGSVRVEMDSLIILAPELVYLVGERRVDADNGVLLYTLGDGMRLQGARGRYYMDSRIGEVDSLPVMVIGSRGQSGSASDDSVVVTARGMNWYGKEETALLAGEVRVGTRTTALTADSLFYWTRNDTGIAWGGPVITDSLGNTAGDTIVIEMREGQLQRIEVLGNARGRYNAADESNIEVSGQVVRILLAGGELDIIEVEKMTRGILVQQRRPEL